MDRSLAPTFEALFRSLSPKHFIIITTSNYQQLAFDCSNDCNCCECLNKEELDALKADMGMETEADGVPSYLQPDKEPDLDAELNLPSAPTGNAAAPADQNKQQGIRTHPSPLGSTNGSISDMGMETEADGVPSYLQPDKEPDLDAELNLPSAPTGNAAAPAGRNNALGTLWLECLPDTIPVITCKACVKLGTPQPVLSRTPMLHMPQTSRGAHAPGRAKAHARALKPGKTVLDNTARAEASRLPEPSTPQTVPGSTPVPIKKS
ncbi:hypothetical protein JCGZ_12208 [Jatropha curcas]|uniref:Uncharacterized protein n=1 Tax=Jatropha curcas TaxID=180498 RepID=A0A067KRX1_JATCU|nr:hypothetical protein JCGZ_12208 [Jatropha curcas]